MTHFLIIDGEPKGKGRPRFTKNGHAYTPQGTRGYEEYVKQCFKIQCQNRQLEEAVKAEVVIYMGIPKSVSQKKKDEMLNGEIHPTKKPDIDNILKIIFDSLNGLAYKDDSQIVRCEVLKKYGSNPSVAVFLEEIDKLKSSQK